LFSHFTLQPARAQSGTIIINPDGSISSPVPANITTHDNVTYTFTGNNYLPIVVNRSNIIINGRGYTVQASGSSGFSVYDISNVTIKNTTITNSAIGIYLDSSFNDNLSGNNVIANKFDGVELFGSYNNIISDNTFTSDGLEVWSAFQNVVTDNLVNGKPLVYLENMVNQVVSDAGQVVLVDCDGIVISDLNLSHASIGVELWNTRNARITDNNMTSNYEGVFLYSSYNNTLSGNNITNNEDRGILTTYSSSDNVVF